jgi:hypothetical protein
MKAEQDARVELIKLNPSNKPQKPEVEAVLERMEKVDLENLAWQTG